MFYKLDDPKDPKFTIHDITTSQYNTFRCVENGAYEIIINEIQKKRDQQFIKNIKRIYASIDDVYWPIVYPLPDKEKTNNY